jgi:hypothetical protein
MLDFRWFERHLHLQYPGNLEMEDRTGLNARTMNG